MNTKLTLTIEHALIEKAKQYAKRHNRSLSDIIENYIKLLISEEKQDEKESMPPITTAMKGAFNAPEGFDYKDELAKQLSKKYNNQ